MRVPLRPVRSTATPLAQGRARAQRAEWLASLLAGACAAACVAPVPLHSTARPPEPARPARVSVPSIVRVRITLPDPDRVTLLADAATLVLHPRGELVSASDGRIATQLALEPPAGERGWRLGDHVHPGRLRVHVGDTGGLELVEELPLEEYVEAVVAAELAIWSAPPAELEAQAIVARTYATRALARTGAVADSTHDQAYRGAFVPAASRGAEEVARKLHDAVRATAGIVLVRDGVLLDARFHAACGGGTAELEDVFPSGGPGTPPTVCAPCAERAIEELAVGTPDPDRPLGWRYAASPTTLAELARSLGIGERVLDLAPVRSDPAGRWIDVRVRATGGERVLALPELRRRLGDTVMRSGRIVRARPASGSTLERGLVLDGLGRGHGVGMCQEGARDYAARGWSAERILAHYFPGARLVDGRADAP